MGKYNFYVWGYRATFEKKYFMRKLIILLVIPVASYAQGVKYPRAQRKEITVRQDPNQARIEAAQRHADEMMASDRAHTDKIIALRDSFRASKITNMDQVVADTALSNTDKKSMLDFIQFVHAEFEKEYYNDANFVFNRKFNEMKSQIDEAIRYSRIGYLPEEIKDGSYKSKTSEK
jgi:hypothetical protein